MVFAEEDRSTGAPEKELQDAVEKGRAGSERWHVRKDGSLFYGSGSSMPLRAKFGALHGVVKIMRDLTDSKRTAEALSEQMDELTRFNTAAVGRETRMIELKNEINDLCKRLGEAPRYSLDFGKEDAPST